MQIPSFFLGALDYSRDRSRDSTSSYYFRPKKVSVLPPEITLF